MNRMALCGLLISFNVISEIANAEPDIKRYDNIINRIFFIKFADERESDKKIVKKYDIFS